jgi:hypothetical protein
MNGFQKLQTALPAWVRMERPTGTPEVTHSQVGGIAVTEVMGFPETPAEAPIDEVAADVHFVEVVRGEDFPTKDELIAYVQDALGEGEFGTTMSADDLAGGPSYITLGGWLGSQDLALMLIGAVELAGIAKAITPKALGMTGEMADTMAGNGLVMLGPSRCWGEL